MRYSVKTSWTVHCCMCRRKKEGREPHAHSEYVRKLHGLKSVQYIYAACCSYNNMHRAKLYNRKRFAEKVEMKKK